LSEEAKSKTVLVSPDEARALSKRFEITVQSSAEPRHDLLLPIRALILMDASLAALFVQFRKESFDVAWLRDMLATRVIARLKDADFDEVIAACQYLADEYHQLGEGYFLVSTETGKVVLVATEDDLYDPGFLARHTGNEAQALKRLNPNLESAFVLHRHERAREQEIVQKLMQRVVQTDLLRQEGDARLRIATRAGRTEIARDLAGDDAYELLRRSSGTTGMFLRHFELSDSEEGAFDLQGVACFRSSMSVHDALTANISYNRLGTLRGAAPQGWVRDIARQLCAEAHRRGHAFPVDVEDLSTEIVTSRELWVADPDVYGLIRAAKGHAVPVEGVDAIGLSGKVGTLSVARECSVESREVSGRWDISATSPYRLSVDFCQLRLLPLNGIERAAVVEN